jgi:hypothetical protein
MAHPPFTRDLSYSLQKKRGVKAPFFPMLDKRFWIYNVLDKQFFWTNNVFGQTMCSAFIPVPSFADRCFHKSVGARKHR